MRISAALVALLLVVAFVFAAPQARKQRRAQKAEKTAPLPGQEPDVDPERQPLAPQGGDLGEAKIAGEVSATRVSPEDRTSDWPGVASGSNGTAWIAYVEWDGKAADRVVVRRRAPGSQDWGGEVTLDDGNWDHYRPAIVARGDGALVIWSGQADGNYELYASAIDASGRAERPRRLTNAPHSDFNVRAATDANGNVTIVWQSFRNGQADVYARRLTGNRWGNEVRVSPSGANDWEPAVALDSRGSAWICWDSYDSGNYDVFLRSFDGASAGQLVRVTSEPDAQFHTSVAVDAHDRVWIAWDEAAQNWGKDFSRSSAAPGSRGLHFSRRVNMRTYSAGKLEAPQADTSAILNGRMSRYTELPNLVVDGSGSVWLVFRHWTWTRPNEIYHFYASRLDGSQWTVPVRLGNSSGQNMQFSSVTRAADGSVLVTYASDGRSQTNVPKDQMHALHYNVYAAKLEKSAAAPADLKFAAVPLAPAATAAPARQRATVTSGGKTYTLLWGDAHRHTDIRGHSGVDGSVLDTYRYALDAAQLDWLGTSDHNEVVGGSWPDGLRDYQWWWTQKAVDLMSHPPRFIGVYSYEHSMMRPGGHRNILFLRRGAPLRAIDRRKGIEASDNAPPALWEWADKNVWTQRGQKMVIVPHTFGAGPLADWNWPNARYDCLLEMYQGARGSYEAWRLPNREKRGPTQTDEPGHFAQDALAKGNVYGFVSFSDHGSTHNSWAAIWAEKPERESLLDAMLARRTFAASDEIVLKVLAGSHVPGERFTLEKGKPFEITISAEAPDTIVRVDVVRNGKYVYTQAPDSRTAQLRYRDNEVPDGPVYYYVRVFQRDPERPDGDPEIAWSSPFFVNYQ